MNYLPSAFGILRPFQLAILSTPYKTTEYPRLLYVEACRPLSGKVSYRYSSRILLHTVDRTNHGNRSLYR